ncbi:MAG: tetratricopeptide repeat protein [Calditrichaeota bacterium]|nr:tetratricopeptide repeat protein [Calditrichota bacterium]
MKRFSLHQLLLIFLLFLFTLPLRAQNQDIDERLFEWVENNSREQLKQRLEKIRSQLPDSPIPLYLEAYLETDGEKAAAIYQKVAENFPDSHYAEAAMMKLGEYFFITKSYQRARFWFDKVVKKFSRSKYAPGASYFSAVCSRMLGDKKKAEKTFKKFIKKYPNHFFTKNAQRAVEQMRSGGKEPVISPEPIENIFQKPEAPPQSENRPFTVQVGAFRDQGNAFRIKEKLASLQYSVEIVPRIVSGRKLYLVRVGSFADKQQAENYGNFLQERFDLSFRVVKKND